MKALHTELKDIRIERGITLEDIYRTTKIRISFLERIEEGDFSVAPELFVRAFLREYAEAVGIDPGRVMARLDGKTTPLVGDEIVQEEPPGEAAEAEPAEDTAEHPPSPEPEIPAAAPENPEPPEIPSPPAPPQAEAPIAAPGGPPHEVTPPAEPEPALKTDASEDSAHEPPAEVRAVGGFFPEEESKSPRALIFGFFFLVIVIAAIAILFLNGIISFNF